MQIRWLLKMDRNKVKGSLYAFAIGDAMGATTEFMHKNEIQKKYGQVVDILGGGWLDIKPGHVTDDTQMMCCVADAILQCPENPLDGICKNFIEWFSTMPADVGRQIKVVITHMMRTTDSRLWTSYAGYYYKTTYSMGNGGLMRCLFPILYCGDYDIAMSQANLTHNDPQTDSAVAVYADLVLNQGNMHVVRESLEPTPFAVNTINNIIYHVQFADDIESTIVAAVNDGGDADTIAALVGGIVGYRFGYDRIPQRWIDVLDSEVKNKLDFYTEKILENN